jgi:protein-S-isoprenylcysteine O-methyltransferase Ste14
MYIVTLCLCLIGLSIRTVYEFLKRSGRVDTKNKTVFWIVFVGMVLMLCSWIFLGHFDPVPLPIPTPIRWFGLVLVLLAVALALLGVLRLKGLENIKQLATDGIYSKLRHPMYGGFILWIIGWTIYHQLGVTIAVAFICIADILLWRKFEEADLLQKHGAAYLMYKKATWF